MRRVLLADLMAAADHLAGVPPDRQAEAAVALLWRAHWAHCYMRRLGKAHSRWGNGSLGSAVESEAGLPRSLAAGDPAFIRALGVLCLEWTRIRAERWHRAGAAPYGSGRPAVVTLAEKERANGGNTIQDRNRRSGLEPGVR